MLSFGATYRFWCIVLLSFFVLQGMTVSSFAQFQSTGRINNFGTITIKGNASISQDSIGGVVRYDQDRQGFRQQVPAITYEQVEFSGVTPKNIVSAGRPLIAHSRFYSSTNAVITYDENLTIIARGKVTHEGIINPAFLFGEMYLQGIAAQNVDGKGTFKVVDLDNNAGADVINGGGFRVHTTLRLTEGELRNSPENNFVMGNDAEIIRTNNGSLRSEPVFEGNNSVRYVGTSSMTSGGEIPSNGSLKNLRVENTEGIILTKNLTVTDSLELRSSIRVGAEDVSPIILTHSAAIPPSFTNDAEIIGAFRRTRLLVGNARNVFNNAYTAVQIQDSAALNGARQLVMRVYPNTAPLPNNDAEKVRRSFSLHALANTGDTIASGLALRVQFGWKSAPTDELNGLTLDRLVLQHWEADRWNNIGISDTGVAENNWYSFNVDSLSKSGFLAIGRSDTGLPVLLSVRVLLEGAARGDTMHTKLANENALPITPPDVYPYNLDPSRASLRLSAPDPKANIVDWVLLEARSSFTREGSDKIIYRIGLVRSDGLIVATDGETPLRLEAGDYYLAVHHRNHLAIMTPEAIRLTPTLEEVFDFTNPQNVLGGIGAGAKLVTLDGKIAAAMYAGDTNADGIINENDDYEFGALSSWVRRNDEGYILSDTDMNSVVNTKDANINWNNRGAASQVSR